MPMTCFCQETAVASQDIALYIFKTLVLSDTAWPAHSFCHETTWVVSAMEDTHLTQRDAQ
jgi:hypothetical protein